MTDLNDRDAAALVALADGRPTRAARRMAARAEAEDVLADLVREQRRIAATVQAAAAGEHAPPHLRAALEAQGARMGGGAPLGGGERARRGAGARLGRAAGFGAAAAALAAAVVLGIALVGEETDPPALAAVVALAGRAPAAAAPAPLPTVDGVRFPGWRKQFGWRAVGAREDRIAGRRAVTVTYEKGGRRAVYTILAGDPLRWPDARAFIRDGTRLKVVRLDGRTVVTWRRGGRTCVLSARDVPRDTLLGLAAWKP